MSSTIISPDMVHHEFERVLGEPVIRFAHQYDVTFDRMIYRAHTQRGEIMTSKPWAEERSLSLDEFSRHHIEPTVRLLRECRAEAATSEPTFADLY